MTERPNGHTYELHIIEQHGELTAILPDVKVRAQDYMEPATDRAAYPTMAPLPDDETIGYRWAPWGHDDCLPTLIREKIYSVPMAARAIYQLTQMMYGNGIAYFRNSELEDGPKVSRAFIPQVEQFLRLNRIATKFLPGQIIDYRFYMNAFSEVIFNKRRDLITGIYHKSAEFCRLSTQDQQTLRINWMYYSPEFAEGRGPQNDKIKKVQLFQWEDQERFLAGLTGHKFAWHSRFETPGATYYARPFWLGLFRKDGWLDVSARVPEIVNAMMNNQIRLKYHVLIPESYFEIRYPEWHTYTYEQKNKVIDSLINKINSTLSGTKNAFQSISTVFRQDISGNDMGKIEIIAVDDKIKDNAWVPSSDRADAQIVQSLGLHPSQVGLAPEGGKMGAGSGSDQRESFNTGITLNTIDQAVILEPLNWIAAFNAQTDPANWDITFFIDHTFHTTTNNAEDGMKPSDTTITPL